jgi:hypothetical protein
MCGRPHELKTGRDEDAGPFYFAEGYVFGKVGFDRTGTIHHAEPPKPLLTGYICEKCFKGLVFALRLVIGQEELYLYVSEPAEATDFTIELVTLDKKLAEAIALYDRRAYVAAQEPELGDISGWTEDQINEAFWQWQSEAEDRVNYDCIPVRITDGEEKTRDRLGQPIRYIEPIIKVNWEDK